MKFKKTIPVILAALVLSATLIGCGSTGSTNNTSSVSSDVATTSVTPAEIMAKIKDEITLNEIQPITTNDLSSQYGIDMNGVKSFAGETDSTGLQVVDVLIIEANDSKSADDILTKLQARQKQRMNEAKNYNPDGYKTAEKGKIDKKGNYLYLFLTNDADKMVKIFDENVK